MFDKLRDDFEERLQEIETYLDLLDMLEKQVRLGPPMMGESTISAQQQKILYSSVYLQLYNLVEATVHWCLKAVDRDVEPLPARLDLRRWIKDFAHLRQAIRG